MSLKMFKEKVYKPFANIQNVIAVAAGKGGVGKSTVSINLALALRHLGYKVGVMDADIYGPSSRKMLSEDRLPMKKDDTIVPALCHGISMMSLAYFRQENQAAAIRAPIANSIISQFIQNVDWGDLDYLLIDFPPGTGDIQLTLSQKAHLTGAIMVTTPQEVSILDVKKAMNLFYQVHVPVIGIMENMSYYLQGGEKQYLFGKEGGKRLARQSGVPLIGEIPIDPNISQLGDSGASLFETDYSAKTLFLEIAKDVNSHIQTIKEHYQSGIQNFELKWRDMQ